MIILYSIVLPVAPQGRIAKYNSIGNITFRVLAGDNKSDSITGSFSYPGDGDVTPNCVLYDALIAEAGFSPQTIYPVS